jgi:deoxyribose-phosphate aldolase
VVNTLTNSQLATYIDHTLLKPDAVDSAIDQLCAEAKQYAFHSVCVNGYWVTRCVSSLAGSTVRVAAVVGFPLGAGASTVKAYEASHAVHDGATEIDMVLPIGLLIRGEEQLVYQDIFDVVQAVREQAIVKVILETVYLTDAQKKRACILAEQAGAQFVKTSTGFGPGGATVSDIQLMRDTVSAHIGVKASGGVRDRATALQMIEAGATRIGTSSGVAIIQLGSENSIGSESENGSGSGSGSGSLNKNGSGNESTPY